LRQRTAAIVGVWVFAGLSPPQITHTTTAKKYAYRFTPYHKQKYCVLFLFLFCHK
jgi:hypothetical protein